MSANSQRVCIDWRRPGGRKPDGVAVVARPSRWGNPYPVADCGRDEALRLYRAYLAASPGLITDARRELRGLNLACYCRLNEPCHADVLLAVVAGGEISTEDQ